MAIYTNLPIYKSAYSLLLAIARITPNMPRECRYSIGLDVRNKVMEIILLVYKANCTKHKANIINRMRESLLEVQVYIRLMCDLKYISEGCYMMLAEQTVSMSKQMTAWEKSENHKDSGDVCNNTSNA